MRLLRRFRRAVGRRLRRRRVRRLKTLVRRAVAEGDLATARERLSDFIARSRGGISPVVHDLLCAIRREQGHGEDAWLAACAGIERRRRRHARAGDLPAPRPLDVRGRIFVSGYFYSGSGAVVDYLREIPGCRKWPVGTGELRLIKFPGGLADLSERCKRAGALSLDDVVDLYLHLVGRKLTRDPRGSYSKVRVVNRNSRKLLRQVAARGYFDEGFTLVERLAALTSQAELKRGKLDRELRDGLDRMLNAAAGGLDCERLVIDQGVTAWRLPISSLVPPSSFILVHRDPRDQYVEAHAAHMKTGRRGWSVEAFCRSYARKFERVQKQVPKLEHKWGHRFLQLAFEDLVLDSERVTGEINAFLGLGDVRGTGEYFDPAVSRGNVGKCRDVLSREELEYIERRLPGYLHEAV